MKVTLIAFFIFLYNIPLFAQESGCGFRLGGIYSTITISHEQKSFKNEGFFGPVFGAIAYKDFSKRFGLYSEGGFSLVRKHHKDTATLYDYENGTYSFEEKVEKLQLGIGYAAILPVFKFTEEIFIMAGPQVDVVLFGNYEGENKRAIFQVDHLPATDYIINSRREKPLKVGFTIGAGFSKKLIRADLRYNFNFGNLFDPSLKEYEPKYVGYIKANYSSLQLSISILVPGMHFGTSKSRYRF